MEWTKMGAGDVKAAEQRLWLAFGDNADMIAERIKTDQDYVDKIAAFAVKEADDLAWLRPKQILKRIATFKVNGGKFVVAEKFRLTHSWEDSVEVPINSINCVFSKHLRSREETIPDTRVKLHRILVWFARHFPEGKEPGIIPALGGKHETYLACFYQALVFKQRREDHRRLICYVRDESASNKLMLVEAIWSTADGGWDIEANSLIPLGAKEYEIVSC
ncbi:MAG: hypothetical protein Q8O94_01540 [bacterium]|nr:hypothetical protein [bacterium]